MTQNGENQDAVIREVQDTPAGRARRAASAAETGFLFLIMGLVIGALFSTFGLEILARNLQPVFGMLIALVIILIAAFALLLLFRRPLWARVFHRTEFELDQLATPLADVARHAAAKDVDAATDAARGLAQVVLARYTWLTARRWLIGAITGLIASIAALSGAILLFKQNELIANQSVLLEDQTNLLTTQTARMGEQNDLLREQSSLLQAQTRVAEMQTQLTEAERNAQIASYVIDVASSIADERQKWLDDGRSIDEFSLAALSAATRGRIVAATLVARPYRYLAPVTANPRDMRTPSIMSLRAAIAFQQRGEAAAGDDTDDDAARTARLASIDRMKDMLARMESTTAATEDVVQLIDRPLSPERGDILSLLVGNSILRTDFLNFQGADFAFAEFRRETLPGMGLRGARLSYASFDWTRVERSEFGHAHLDFARFRNAEIDATSFSSIGPSQVRAPFTIPQGMPFLPTRMTQVDFSDATIANSRFEDVQGAAMRFDRAAIAGTSFARASMGGSSFANAVLFDVDMTGANLASVDFEGALVNGRGVLERWGEQAVAGTWAPGRWQLEPVPFETYQNHPRWAAISNYVDDAKLAAGGIFRVVRVPGK